MQYSKSEREFIFAKLVGAAHLRPAGLHTTLDIYIQEIRRRAKDFSSSFDQRDPAGLICKGNANACNTNCHMVGATGLEPVTSCV